MGKTRFRLGTALALSMLCHGGALAALLAAAPPPRPVPPSQSYAVTFWHPPIPAPPQPAAPVAVKNPEPAKAEPVRHQIKAVPPKPTIKPVPAKAVVPKAAQSDAVPVTTQSGAAPVAAPAVTPASFTPIPAQPDAPPAPPPVVRRADYLSPPTPPVYPAPARRLGIEGTVIIRALVERPGLASEVTVWRSSGESLLDRSALEAVRNWRFHPMTQGGATIAAWVEVPITFSISNT